MARLETNSRSEILALLNGARIGRVPAFSGLVNITTAGLDTLGLRFSEIHTDARKLAAAAATSYRLFGWESAVVPSDLCVEAGVLGAKIDFQTDVAVPLWPVVAAPLAPNALAFHPHIPAQVDAHPRVAAVIEALRILKREVGAEIVVGGWVPGPLTLAMQVLPLNNLYADIRDDPRAVSPLLDRLTDLIIEVARAYHAAGADFLTVHEMGGSPGVLGPVRFGDLVLPHLERLLAALPAPRILSVCGDTNAALPVLAQAGADALAVDQLNDLARSRALLGDKMLLFGNLDPVKVLERGTPEQVAAAVVRARVAGVAAVWPGCDLPPTVPAANMRAFASRSS